MGITAHAAARAINGIMMSQVISVQAVGEHQLASMTSVGSELKNAVNRREEPHKG
jgi:hypothetical protein